MFYFFYAKTLLLNQCKETEEASYSCHNIIKSGDSISRKWKDNAIKIIKARRLSLFPSNMIDAWWMKIKETGLLFYSFLEGRPWITSFICLILKPFP
jgi:hypothetical protein